MTERAWDPYKPNREPALTLYEAFQKEAQLRKGRQVKEWIEAERQAVWQSACVYARQHGLVAPTLEQVIAAETYAMGSVDYGSKWAYGVERHMQVQEPR